MIRVTDLTKRYNGTPALDRLELSVPDRSIFGLVGPNGSGKTTLFKLLLGFIFPDAGRIDLGGVARTRIGYVPERPFLPPGFRVREYLSLCAELSGLSGHSLRESVELRLRQVELTQAAKMRIGALSKGMQQRLSLAAALVHDPPLLLLDEPMSGLDPAQQAAIRQLVISAHQAGKTILLSTHRLTEVSDVCTHVAIMRRGRVVQSGELDEILPPRALMTIHVDCLPQPLAAALAAQFPGIGLEDNKIELSGPLAAKKNEVLRLLLDAGCDIRELRQNRATLEEIYLEAIRG